MVENNAIYGKIAKTNQTLDNSINASFSSLTINISTIEANLSTLSMNISYINDKIGEITDTYIDSTLFGVISKDNMYNYTSSLVYPTSTTVVTLVNNSYVEVIPVNTITHPFSITGAFTGLMTSAVGWYSFIIAKGSASSEIDIATTADYNTSDYEINAYKNITTPILPANTRVSVKLIGADTTSYIKLAYQEYI
jgi:hypothetical protein